ncbi:MAG: molybdopterin molybdotransferase MoeA [Coriobacteriales bacterium]|jgi:molybdopterin molybdotransferase|nr:molybdopterin molybdotransferase MoeA [Coriobacteriales bacterium]
MSERYCNDSIIGVEDAQELLLAHVSLLDAEKVALGASFGRILAQEVRSDIDISPFDNSAMDGFAVCHADFVAARPAPSREHPLELPIIGRLGAGSVFDGELTGGQALRIMTGAPLPRGADTVVKIEETEVIGESDECPEGTNVRFFTIPVLGEHVRPRGEEARKGEVLLHAGDRISPAAAGLLASTGNAEVLVYRRARVGIISSGSELVAISEIPGPGQIRNSNSYSLAAQVAEAGGEPVILPAITDTREAFIGALQAAVAQFDFIITSGGAAEGDFDFVTPAIRELGELFYNKVNMKPGKAQTFGIIGSVPIFGLPGNPAAAAVGFEVLVRPALRRMQGMRALKRPVTRAVLTTDIKKVPETRRFYLRARVERVTDGAGEGAAGVGAAAGTAAGANAGAAAGGGAASASAAGVGTAAGYRVTPAPNQSSALLGALNNANCLLVVPEGLKPLAAGDTVACLRLDMEEGVV